MLIEILVTTSWIIPVGVTTITILLGLIGYDYIKYNYKKKNLPGPKWVLPFIGSIVSMVRNPTNFWNQQEKYGKISWNKLGGYFMVHSNDATVTKKILQNNTDLKPILHPNANTIFGKNNMAFQQGKPHKQLRAVLLPLFTKKALSLYLKIQEKVIRRHLSKWINEFMENDEPINMRLKIRDLNLETSQNVFVGPYLTEKTRKIFAENYMKMNKGFLSLPINLPGTKLWNSVQARKKIVILLKDCAKQSSQKMVNSNPQCLLDFYILELIKKKKIINFDEVGNVMLDFLFASQDASTASLVWSCALCLTEHPKVLNKVIEEQSELRPYNGSITYEILKDMKYTKIVMMEILRYRAPATMVPQIALKDYPITIPASVETKKIEYVIPKGSIITPSLYAACQKNWKNPDKFNPDRFNSDQKGIFIPFGCGPHRCIGMQYAMNHITMFISILSTSCKMKRYITSLSGDDNIVYGPTIFPADGVNVSVTAI